MVTYILCGYCPHRRRLQRTTSPGAVVKVCVKSLKFGNNTAMRSGCHSFHKVKIMSLGSQQKCFLFSSSPHPPLPPASVLQKTTYANNPYLHPVKLAPLDLRLRFCLDQTQIGFEVFHP